MPAIRELVDVEALLRSYLPTVALLADLVGDRISTQLPPDFADEATVKFIRVGGTPVDGRSGHLDRALVQFDCYGPTKGDAFAVARATIAAAWAAPDAAHDDAVVTNVERVSGPLWSPDPVTDTPRYLVTMAITTHPTA